MGHELVQSGKSFHYLQPLMDEILVVRYTDLDRLLACCKELLSVSEREGYIYGTAFAITYFADYHIALNDGQSSSPYLEKALKLCLQQKYDELLMNVYIFYGIYYDMMLDLLSSLNCVLDALELATKLNNSLKKSIITNNIANIFENFGDVEAAKKYYGEAMRYLEEGDNPKDKNPHYSLLLANLVHMSCYLGEVEEAEAFAKGFDYSEEDNDSVLQHYVSQCHIAVARDDIDLFYSIADKIIDISKNYDVDGYQLYEILIHIAKYALRLKNKEYANDVLMVLNSLTGEDEIGNRIRVQKYWVEFYEMFGTDEQQGWAYKRYYKLKQIIDVTNNKAMAAGLHAKIGLHEATKQQAQMVKENAKLEKEAQRDELTQLYNRRSFSRIVEAILDDEAVTSLGFAMIDVDYFKQYNDTYGHARGDDILQAVAKCMVLAADKNESIYNFRYGGDEFMCVYSNCTITDMEKLVGKIVSEVSGQAIVHESSLCSDVITLSIGFSVETRKPEERIDANILLEQSDNALYKAKERGRNTSCAY